MLKAEVVFNMGDIRAGKVNDLKKGSYVVIDGAACRVVDTESSKPGKHGAAKYKITAVDLINGQKKVILMSSGSNIEVPVIEKRSAQVLSISGDVASLMDSETFESFDVKVDNEEVEGGPVVGGAEVLYWDILGQKMVKQVKKPQ